MEKITPQQLKRLQVLYNQLVAHTDQENTREARLGWASGLVQREISSFKDLTSEDARHLIDTLQGQLGIAPTRPFDRIRDRDRARKAGTEGRRGQNSKELTMATAADLDRITYVRELLGMSQAGLDGFLRSSSSPLKNRSNPQIRTLGDANRVYWALKRMAERQGKWKKEERRAS